MKYYHSDQNEKDVYLYHEGKNYKSYEFLGAHKICNNGEEYMRFAIWAPNAKAVFLMGDFNSWNREDLPLKRINGSGVWGIYVSNVKEFDAYKFRLISWDDREIIKADPYSFHAETRPKTASKIYDIDGFEWTDKTWMNRRKKKDHFHKPMSIYEMHLGSWMRHPDGSFYSYLELAERLPDYIKEMGYTHVEFLPITEFPYDGSWGYQVTGYFAATSRFGTPKDLMYLIDSLHRNNIGVFMDWVPVHFTKDDHGLREFDGSCLYEKNNPYAASAEGWGTLLFDFYKPEVRNFLISSALFWLDKYHFDGIRVDAVAAMLYLNFGGKNLYNEYGGTDNHEAVEFIKELNSVVHLFFSDCLMMAEESSDWEGITAPVDEGGLGFDFKWNMGWMNDTLRYIAMDPINRKHHHDLMTFSLMYAFKEKYILPFSHDEVVHLKKSMINKIPGDYHMKFAGLKGLYAYMYAHPGKKLLFMGSDIGSFDEWNENVELPWSVLSYDKHRGLKRFVSDLNNIYKKYGEFYELDTSYDGFNWVDVQNSDESIFIFERINKKDERIICIFNFTPVYRAGYKVGVLEKGIYKTILNSEHRWYGGLVNRNKPYYTKEEYAHNREHSIEVDIPGYSAILIKLSTRKK
ncbi:MAG: 1,4-alpha-glucan branching protein GlgB [Tissierellia bacterium]|nr:1,4-alpha-glucan branching protein GlgB [Tissierellia bacterium]